MIDTDEPCNSSLESAEYYQYQVDVLQAEVRRLRLIAWDLYLFYTDMGYDGSLSMIEDRMDWVSDEAFYGGEEQ